MELTTFAVNFGKSLLQNLGLSVGLFFISLYMLLHQDNIFFHCHADDLQLDLPLNLINHGYM